MAIPAVVGTAKTGRTGAGNLTVTMPGGVHWIAIFQKNFDIPTPATPSGWTLIRSYSSSGSDSNTFIYLSNSATPSNTFVVTGSHVYPSSLLVIGYNATLTERHFASGSTATAPTLTTTFADCLILRIVGDANDATTAIGYPSNATLYRDQIVTPHGGGAWSQSIAVAHSEKAAVGAVGTAAFSVPSPYQPISSTLAFTGTPPAGESYSGSLGFEGSGLLTLSGVALHTAEGSLGLSGEATLEAELTTFNVDQALNLSAEGSLTLTGVPQITNSLEFSGSGTFTLVGDKLQEESGTLDFSGDSSLSIAGVANPGSDISLSGSGELTLTGYADVSGTVTLGGSVRLQLRDFTKSVGEGNWTRADDEMDYLENVTGIIHKTLADLRHHYWKSILLKERTNNDLEKEFQELRLQVLYNQFTLGDLQAVNPKYYEEDQSE